MRNWRRHSREFKQQVVERMKISDNIHELAQELGIKGNDKVKVTSARSFYIAKAFVTKRIRPMTIDGKKIYQIGIPIHQGYRGIQEDADRNARTIANRLSPTVVDPNAYTPEFKGFLVKLEKA